MKKYLVEFIGTYLLVLMIGNVVIGPEPVGSEDTVALTKTISGFWPPLAIGLGLIALVYGGGHTSAAHYNPAVTVAFLLRGKCEIKDVVPYIFAQIGAAVAAAFTVHYLKGTDTMEVQKVMEPDVPKALLAEAIGTFMLVWVILNVAISKETKGNQFYGIAIGLTVTGMAYTLGQYSGAVFNPSVAVGISLMGLSAWQNIWIYLVASILGSVVAVAVFAITERGE